MNTEHSEYKAIISDGTPWPTVILSVIASSPEEAREKAREELSKPGRGAYLTAWENAGSEVKKA